jgi:hypothetical protein
MEAKSKLQQMLQEIPLRDEEPAAMDKLCTQVLDVPTLAGPTLQDLAPNIHGKLTLTQLAIREIITRQRVTNYTGSNS